MTLPHCTGCTEPGEHQQETVEHIHDGCPKLWDCPDCGFAFDAVHTDVGTDEHTCPVCEEARLERDLTEANATIAELRDALEKVRGLSISPTFDVATDALAGQR